MEAEIKARWPESEVSLVAGSRGIFDVVVDGELVFSKHQEGRHIDPGEIIPLLEARGWT